MMNINVRKTNDYENAYSVALKLPNYFDKNGLESIKKDTKTNLLYCAYLDSEIVGFVTYKEINPQVIELTWMGVLPQYHGKGIGTKMILDSLKELNKYKVCEVKTVSDKEPDEGYARTRNFYEKLGFIPLESIIPYPGWNDPCVIYVKWLK